MKRSTSIIASALAMVAMVSCTKDGGCTSCPDAGKDKEQQEQAVLKVSMAFPEDDAQTRALAAYTAVQEYEKAINKIQILVFDASGMLNAYKNVGTSTSASITTTTGQKTVWAVINGPDLSGVATLNALRGRSIALSSNSTSAATGFVMAGSTSCNLTKSGASASISVSRLTGRIALKSVTNSLPSVYRTLTVKKVYAINVTGEENLAGTMNASPALNLAADKGDVPALLSKTVSKSVANGSSYAPATPDLFYCYANSSSKNTCLVVETEVSGKTFYYPIFLSSIERNKAYTVSLDIQNLGSNEPDVKPEKGAITVNISVAGWDSGANYEESI